MTAVAAPRAAARAGAVLALLYAALVLAAESGEYPALSRPGLGALAEEVLPAAGAAVLTLAALEAPPPTSRWWWWLALAASVALLAQALPNARPGSPPAPFLLAGVAALLAVANGAVLVTARRRGVV